MTSLWLDRSRTIETDPFLADASYDDVVVGAGLTGLVTACLLARAGHRVAVLEARHIGAVTTGNTTAKLSLLQGTTLSKIIRNHSERVAAAYIEGNREALAWTLRYCEDSNVPIERRDAYTYAGKQSGASAVQKEFEAAQRLGLEVERVDADELPYSTYGAVRLPEQAQFDPLDMLTALAAELRSRDGVLVEGVRAEDVSVDESDHGAHERGSGDRGQRHSGHRHPLPGPRSLLRQGHAAAVVRARLPGARSHPQGHVSVGRFADPFPADGAA